MEAIRTTLCQFYPDMRRADLVYDFAVLGASRDSIVFWAIDLKHYGLDDTNPIVSDVIAHTSDALIRKIENVLIATKPSSGLQALDLLVRDNLSCIQFAPIREHEPGTPLLDDVVAPVSSRSLSEGSAHLKRSFAPRTAHQPRWTERGLNAEYREIPFPEVWDCEQVHA